MNSNCIFPNFIAKQAQLFPKPNNLQNWMNRPKAFQPLKLVRQPQSFLQVPNNCRQAYEKNKESTIFRSSKNKLPQKIHLNSPKNSQTFNKYFQGSDYPPAQHPESHKTKLANNIHVVQNIPPNIEQYTKMHTKLSSLEDKLTKMKQKFHKKKQQRKSKNFIEENQLSKTQMVRQKEIQQALKEIVTQENCPKNSKAISLNRDSSKSTTYYISQLVKGYKEPNSLVKEHLISSFQQLRRFRKVKGFTKDQLALKQLKLPRKAIYENKKTVIFDLDETLIHCNQNPNLPCDAKLSVKFPTGKIIEVGINIRPYTFDVLKRLSKNFQIIIFTASHQCYANVVLDYLDPEKKYISHRLFRQHCFQTPQGVYIKDLRIINRQLTDLVLVDNAAYSFCLQIQNGIPIIPFYRGKVDFQLQQLEKYVQSLIFCKDVRDCNRNAFKLNKYNQFQDPEALFKNLYDENLEQNYFF